MGSLLRPMRRLLAHAQRCMAHWPLPLKATTHPPTHLQAMVVGSVPVGVGATQLKIAPLTCNSGRELLLTRWLNGGVGFEVQALPLLQAHLAQHAKRSLSQ